MPHSLLLDLVIAYGVGIVAVLALHRVRVPTVVAFVVAGAIVGPYGLRLVRDRESVDALADVGVVVLLFSVGAEMNLSRLLRHGGRLLGAGALQMLFATGLVALAVRAAGEAWAPAVVAGLLVAASSTVLVMTLLGQRGELEAPQGRVAAGILLFQDLCVIPILLLLPLLGGETTGTASALLTLGKAAGVLLGTFVLARLLVPRLLEAVVSTRSRELFALTVIFLCLGTAFLVRLAGVPLALGAFLGGLVISESAYAHQALGDLRPIRDGLSGLFFLGIGMLLDARSAAENAPLLALVVGGMIAAKALTTGAAVLLSGHGPRVAAILALALAQVGEFSFVLAREAQARGIAPGGGSFGMLLTAGVLTMVATPVLVRFASPVADALTRRAGRRRSGADEPEGGGLSDHVVLVGYGLCGRNVALSLRANGIPYTVVEMNPETVRREAAAGTPIRWGDAGHVPVLESLGIERARGLVVAISDAASTRRIVAAAKALRPDLHVIARTRYVREAEALKQLGADEVVPEELETSIEVASHVLRHYRLPREAIDRVAAALRANEDSSVRGPHAAPGLQRALADAALQVELEMHVVGPGAPVDGRTIGDLGLRRRHGVTIVGVRRGDDVLGVPDAETALQAGDVVVVLGRPELLARAAALFRPPGPGGDGTVAVGA
jgi:CPA2 family monovalent cation:H+ antiporter-2